MAFQSVPDCAEAVVRYTLQGVPIVNTFYGIHPGGYSSSDIENLADAVDGWVGAEWLPVQSNHVTYIETVARGLELLNDFESSANASAGVGGVSASPMPANLTFAISRRSLFTGRSARGRIYVPALWPAALNSANENLLLTTIRDNFVDALNLLNDAMVAAGWFEVIVSRFTGGAKRTTGLAYLVEEYVATDLRVDTQRRRLS